MDGAEWSHRALIYVSCVLLCVCVCVCVCLFVCLCVCVCVSVCVLHLYVCAYILYSYMSLSSSIDGLRTALRLRRFYETSA